MSKPHRVLLSADCPEFGVPRLLIWNEPQTNQNNQNNTRKISLRLRFYLEEKNSSRRQCNGHIFQLFAHTAVNTEDAPLARHEVRTYFVWYEVFCVPGMI